MKKIDLKDTKAKLADSFLSAKEATKKVIEDMPGKAIATKQIVGEKYEKAKYEMDLKKYAPIFEEAISTYEQPILLRVVKYDKRMEIEACKGAVGFEEKIKMEKVFHLYKETAGRQGIQLYPYVDETIYCKDPYENNKYIALDEYFDYIRKSKVAELEMIAQCLGAKYFKVTYNERKKSILKKDSKASAKIIGGNKGEVKEASSSDEYSSIKIASESTFDGTTEKIKPTLKYFRHEQNIIDLVNNCLDVNSRNPLKKKVYQFECTTTKDMKENVAANIDAVLKVIKMNGNVSMMSEYQEQQRIVLEYTIEF